LSNNVARPVTVPCDEYFTLHELARYCKLSPRQLRNYLNLPPGQALPCYRPGRRVLVRRTEFDTWFSQYRQRGKPVLLRVLRELGLDPERLPKIQPAEKAFPR
jgi:Helix-turn-helix domain